MPLPSLTVSPAPALAPHDAAWLHALQDSLDQIEAEARKEIQSTHPGARHRLTDLRICADDRRRQIAALRAQS